MAGHPRILALPCVLACAHACTIEPNPAFDGPTESSSGVADTADDDGGSEAAATTTTTTTTGGSESSTGDVGEGCYDGILTVGEMCFEYRLVTLGQDGYSVATGDFDGDGNLDAVLGSWGSAIVLFGDGHGEFHAMRTIYGAAFGATGATAPDLDEDGLADIVLSYPDGNGVDVFLALPYGGFADAQHYDVGAPGRIVSGFIDDDPLVDIVTANFMGTDVAVLYGVDGGTLEAGPPAMVGATPNSISTADVDGNGLGDIIVASESSGTIDILVNMGDGAFADPMSIPFDAAHTITAEDLDQDGLLDLFVATSTQQLFVAFGSDFSDDSVWWNYTGRAAEAVVTGDFNNDGKRDLALAEGFYATTTFVLAGEERDFWVESWQIGTFPIALAAGDFNNDGIPDLVFANIESDVGLSMLLSVP